MKTKINFFIAKQLQGNMITIFHLCLLTIFFESCKEGKEIKNPAPVADFTYTIIGKAEVRFNSISQNAETITWEYGDGTKENIVINPTHIYRAPGTYTAKLTAKGLGGEHSTSKQIVIQGVKPTAAFSFVAEANGCVQFKNESTNADGYTWEFEGGTPATSTQPNPRVCFNYNGTYKIKLKSVGFGGETTIEKTVIVTNGKAPLPIADFTITDLGKGVYKFTNTSRNGVYYDWYILSFTGYGSSVSTKQDLTYTFMTNNTQTIKLCVTNLEGKVCQEQSIKVTSIPSNTIRDKIMGVWIANSTCTNLEKPLSYRMEFKPEMKADLLNVHTINHLQGYSENGRVVGDSLSYSLSYSNLIREATKGKISADGNTITIISEGWQSPATTYRCIGTLKRE